MGARGPKPQPSNVRALMGETRPSRQREETPAPDEEPTFPEWMADKEAPTPEVREVWERVYRHLRAMKMLTAVDQSMIQHYVHAVWHMDRIAKVVIHAPAVVRDANGQPRANPLLGEWRKAASEVRVYGALFGMSGPTSRIASRESVIGSEARVDDLAG